MGFPPSRLFLPGERYLFRGPTSPAVSTMLCTMRGSRGLCPPESRSPDVGSVSPLRPVRAFLAFTS
jgi:hypothetical protein